MVLHPNDDDPAVPAPEPHLPLLNDDDDNITEPWPVPSPPPKEVVDIIEPKRYWCQNCCPPWPFNNNSYSSDDDCSFGAVVLPPELIEPSQVPLIRKNSEPERYLGNQTSCPPPPFNNNSYSYNSYNISNPPHDQSIYSSALQQAETMTCSSRIRKKPSSNNNLDLKGHVMVKVRTTPRDIIKLENNTRIIPEEEAVCRFCFHQLFPVNNDHNNNNDNVLKTKCLCPFTLTHQHCATEWSRTKGNIKCDVCDQDTIYIPITLSAPPRASEEKSDKGSFISTLKKWSCFTTG